MTDVEVIYPLQYNVASSLIAAIVRWKYAQQDRAAQ